MHKILIHSPKLPQLQYKNRAKLCTLLLSLHRQKQTRLINSGNMVKHATILSDFEQVTSCVEWWSHKSRALVWNLNLNDSMGRMQLKVN